MARQVHNLDAGEVFGNLHSRPEGLDAEEVEERRREVGPNSLARGAQGRWLASLGRQFTNFFTILLFISAAICFVADHLQPGESMAILGWALLGVAVLNALFAFVQEFRAERAMEALRKFLPQKVMVRRAARKPRSGPTTWCPATCCWCARETGSRPTPGWWRSAT